MIWAIDLDNRFTFVNDAVKQIHGYEPEEMIGPAVHRLPEPGDRRAATSRRRRRPSTARPTTSTRPSTCARTAPPYLLSFNAATLRDGEGKIIGVTGSARDVTEQRADGGGGGREAPAAPVDHRQLAARDLRQGRRPPLRDRQPRARGAALPPRRRSRGPDRRRAPGGRGGRAAPRRGPAGARLRPRVRGGGGAHRRRPRARLPAAPVPAPRDRRRASTASAASAPTSPSAASARTRCGRSSSGPCASAARSTRTGSCCTPSRSSRSPPGARSSRSCSCGCGERTASSSCPASSCRRPSASTSRRDRPLGHRPGRAAGREGRRRGEPLGPEHRRRSIFPSTSRPSSRAPGADPSNVVFEITETAAGADIEPATRLRRAAVSARLRLRARRLRHRLRQLHLPEAPAGRLPQDRHRVRARPEAGRRRTCRS